MTRITTCVASLSVFVAICISYGADPLQLADQQFLQDDSTGNVTVQQYYGDFGSCMYDFDYSWFDFNDLSQFQVVSSTTIATFNLCGTQTSPICPGSSAATIVSGAHCSLNTLNKTQSYYNATDTNSTLALVFSDGTTEFKVALWCDTNAVTPLYGPLVQQNSEYSTSVTYSKLCPILTYSNFTQTMINYSWLWGGIFIVLGLMLSICGVTFYPFIIGVIVASIFTGGMLLIFYSTFLDPTIDTKTQKACNAFLLIGSILVGVFFGWIATKFQKLTIATVAGWFGYVIGIFITVTAMKNVISIWQWLIIVALVLIATIVALCYDKEAVILATATVGSYLFIRGIGIYAGGFPNEYLVIRQMRDASSFDWHNTNFYLYLASIVVLTALTTFGQIKIYLKQKGDHLQPYELMQ